MASSLAINPNAPVFADLAPLLWQELPVFALFFASLVLWRHMLPRTKWHPAGHSKVSKLGSPSCDGLLHSESRGKGHQAACALPATPKEPPSQVIQAAEKQMLTLLANCEFTRALNRFRSFERDGRDRGFRSEELFSAFVQSAIRVGKVDVVERMVRSMLRNGLVPSLSFWQTTLKMLSSRKHFQACLSIHEFFAQSIPLDKVVYSCLINAALDCSEPVRAVDILKHYEDVEPPLQPKDHVLFFRTYVAVADVDSAVRIFRKLGANMTTLMANLLLLTFVNAKMPEQAKDILHELHEIESEVEGDPITDVVSYNTVIKGFSEAGRPRQCFECLQEMRSRGIEPDDVTLGSLLDVCVVGNDIGAVQEAACSFLGGDQVPDVVVHTLLIKVFLRMNDPQKAMDIYKSMRSHAELRPDFVIYSVLIRALVESHDLDGALGLMNDMVRAGHQPDDIILTHLLEGCRRAGKQELGRRLFTDILSAGVKPSEFTLITLVKLHGRCGSHEEAREIVETWEGRYGTKPSVIHYTCLMSGCVRTKNYEQAWKAYRSMGSSGIPPDETAVATLLPGLVAGHMWDEVLELVALALKGAKPVPVPSETLNSALWQMLQGEPSAQRHAEQLADLMRGRGVVISPRNVQRLSLMPWV